MDQVTYDENKIKATCTTLTQPKSPRSSRGRTPFIFQAPKINDALPPGVLREKLF